MAGVNFLAGLIWKRSKKHRRLMINNHFQENAGEVIKIHSKVYFHNEILVYIVFFIGQITTKPYKDRHETISLSKNSKHYLNWNILTFLNSQLSATPALNSQKANEFAVLPVLKHVTHSTQKVKCLIIVLVATKMSKITCQIIPQELS